MKCSRSTLREPLKYRPDRPFRLLPFSPFRNHIFGMTTFTSRSVFVHTQWIIPKNPYLKSFCQKRHPDAAAGMVESGWKSGPLVVNTRSASQSAQRSCRTNAAVKHTVTLFATPPTAQRDWFTAIIVDDSCGCIDVKPGRASGLLLAPCLRRYRLGFRPCTLHNAPVKCAVMLDAVMTMRI